MSEQRSVERIGLRLAGDEIPLRAFVAAAEGLADLLRELEAAVSGEQRLDWNIEDLGTGSAHIAVRPCSEGDDLGNLGTKVIASALNGLALVEQEPTRPADFTDEALKCARSLTKTGRHIEGIAFFGTDSVAAHEVTVTKRLAKHVDELIGTASVAIGAVEGKLEALTIHGGVSFSIYDVISARRIRCICDRETLNLAIGHFGGRMSVSGEVRFNVRGEATSVKVHSLQPLGTKSLPQPEDIRGLFKEHKIDIDEWSSYVREK